MIELICLKKLNICAGLYHHDFKLIFSVSLILLVCDAGFDVDKYIDVRVDICVVSRTLSFVHRTIMSRTIKILQC